MKLRMSKSLSVLVGVVLSIALWPTARGDVLAYATLSGGPFGVQDLTTGTFTSHGNITSTLGLNGLGEIGGTLYGIGSTLSGHNNTLYKVNPAEWKPYNRGHRKCGF